MDLPRAGTPATNTPSVTHTPPAAHTPSATQAPATERSTERSVASLTNSDVSVLGDAMARLFEAASDGIVVVDGEGIIALANPMAHTLFGYQQGALIGLPVEELVPEHRATTHRAHRLRYRVNPQGRFMGDQTSRLAARRSDGSTFPVDVALSPVELGSSIMTLAVARDVSERVLAETEHDIVRRSLDSIDDAVLMFELPSLRHTYVNQGAIHQLGYGRDALVAMTPLHVLPEYTHESFRLALEPMLSGEQPVIHLSTRVMRADGTETPVEIRLQYPDIEGVRRVVAISRDVSDRERAAERLRESEARISLIEERERIGRDLHDVVIQRLFATGMQLQAALGSPQRLSERAQSTIADLDETIAAIRDTIFQLTTANIPLEREVGIVIDRHRRASHNEIEAYVDGPLETMNPDVGQHLVATLNELLSNVSRHAKATQALVTVRVSDESVDLTVSDDGVGMTDDARRGYGLSNVARRARELGGDFEVMPGADGKGLTANWSIPTR